MKRIRFVGTGALLLLLGVSAPVYPKQQEPDKQQQDQNKQQDKDKQQQAKPEKQQQAKGQQEQQRQQEQQAKGQQEQQRQQRQALNKQQQQQAQQQQSAWQQHRAQNWQSEHRDWQQRGGYTADRIPDDRYRSNFGPDHAFRIYQNPVVVSGGYPGFQYGGFYFSVVGSWPESWSNDWYENDDVYVDYSGDGYYMYNRRYPQDRIAVSAYGSFVQLGDRRDMWLRYRARNWRAEHRNWQQRGGYNGYRIPDDRYRGYFGRNHRFRIYNLPLVVVGGEPRFQYGGFWFSVVDPWPENWSTNWYQNNEVYIDYSGDGYYLYNRSYPGSRIAVEVYVN
jgi:hypothetical protein